jgi:hypothetical protein
MLAAKKVYMASPTAPAANKLSNEIRNDCPELFQKSLINSQNIAVIAAG